MEPYLCSRVILHGKGQRRHIMENPPIIWAECFHCWRQPERGDQQLWLIPMAEKLKRKNDFHRRTMHGPQFQNPRRREQDLNVHLQHFTFGTRHEYPAADPSASHLAPLPTTLHLHVNQPLSRTGSARVSQHRLFPTQSPEEPTKCSPIRWKLRLRIQIHLDIKQIAGKIRTVHHFLTFAVSTDRPEQFIYFSSSVCDSSTAYFGKRVNKMFSMQTETDSIYSAKTIYPLHCTGYALFPEM